ARSVTGPLRALAATATGLAGGNLEARARVKSSDEVGQLARAFNAMIPQLRSHISTKESLALACEVQQKLLPKSPPQIPNIEIAGRCAYSEDVGGDYYDFIQFPMTSGGQRVGIVVGDVVGHGVVAALTMTAVRALLRSHASDGSDLSAVMNAVNRHVAADASGGRFITLVYLVIDSNPRRIRWISAGHGPTLLYDVKNDTFDELPIEDIPLGIRPNWAFRECGREGWPEPAVLVMGTDGIWETRDASGATFGKPRLKQLIRAYAHLSAEDICDKVVEQLRAFAGDEPQRDDITLVVVKFAPSERAS
ncbi:MAG: SpoIIE family protein phosphatase, partial [Rhodospirillaceae bacterium]